MMELELVEDVKALQTGVVLLAACVFISIGIIIVLVLSNRAERAKYKQVLAQQVFYTIVSDQESREAVRH